MTNCVGHYYNIDCNTPSRKDALSPAQKLFGHPVQDILPAHHRTFLPEWQRPIATTEQQRCDNWESSTAYYNQHTHPLSDITVGSPVAIQNPKTKVWDIYGIITEITSKMSLLCQDKGWKSVSSKSSLPSLSCTSINPRQYSAKSHITPFTREDTLMVIFPHYTPHKEAH